MPKCHRCKKMIGGNAGSMALHLRSCIKKPTVNPNFSVVAHLARAARSHREQGPITETKLQELSKLSIHNRIEASMTELLFDPNAEIRFKAAEMLLNL